MPKQANQRLSDRLLRLSPRETQVVEMASLGLTNGQIAERLTVTDYGVKLLWPPSAESSAWPTEPSPRSLISP